MNNYPSMDIVQNNPLEAIEYNNFAVSMMEKANMEQAITVLTHGLEASKKTFLDFDDADSIDFPNLCLDDYVRQSPILRIDIRTNGTKHPKQAIYNTAIRIPVVSTYDYETSVSISSAIFFNLGLCHHLLGIQTVSSSVKHRYLENASQMYQLAYQLQQEDSSESNILFQMATLNNLGLVFWTMDDMKTSRRCFQLLLSNLLYVIDCGGGDSSEYDNFVQNTKHVIFDQECLVAAAA